MSDEVYVILSGTCWEVKCFFLLLPSVSLRNSWIYWTVVDTKWEYGTTRLNFFWRENFIWMWQALISRSGTDGLSLLKWAIGTVWVELAQSVSCRRRSNDASYICELSVFEPFGYGMSCRVVIGDERNDGPLWCGLLPGLLIGVSVVSRAYAGLTWQVCQTHGMKHIVITCSWQLVLSGGTIALS